jgi:hypothetical protein
VRWWELVCLFGHAKLPLYVLPCKSEPVFEKECREMSPSSKMERLAQVIAAGRRYSW